MSTHRRSWPLVAALVAISTVPVISGTLRLIEVAGGPAVMPANERYGTFPLPLVLHIVSAIVFALGGIGLLLPRFRRRYPAWHRRTGRVLVPAGLVAATSGLAMTLFYQAQPNSGPMLYAFRLVFGSAMAASLVLGLAAIRQRDVAAHRAWMIRAYAIGLAAGTQALTDGVAQAFLGTGVVVSDLAKGSAWVINLGVAELAIRRPDRAPTPTTALPVGVLP